MNRSSGWAAVIIGTLTATIPTVMLFQAVTYLFVVPLVLGLLCIVLGVTALRTEGTYGKHVGWIAVILMLVGVIVPFGMIAYYDRSGYPIVLVVPTEYRGPIRLIIDRKNGLEVPLVNKKYTYRVPETGTLLIKDDSPFRQWHSMTVIYANGKLIPNNYEGKLPPDTVSHHSLGSGVKTQDGKRQEYMEDFIGTKAEFKKYVGSH
jgi:hypothetical protein